MAVILSKTYNALVLAGVPNKEAEEASEEIAGMDRRLIRPETMVGIAIAGIGLLIGGMGYIITLIHSVQ
ncbi:MAG: hypothetical protein HAW58_02480 [Candidatus Thioglobus sp.]|nr:hypothetical protein [Candidatus Thioglobus sp.]